MFIFVYTVRASLAALTHFYFEGSRSKSTKEKPYKGWTSFSDPKATRGGGEKTPKGRKAQIRGEETTQQGFHKATWQGPPGAPRPCRQVPQRL